MNDRSQQNGSPQRMTPTLGLSPDAVYPHRGTEAGEALEELFSELQQVFDCASDGICVIGTDFRIYQANVAFLQLLGLGEEKVLGHRCHELFCGRVCATARCPLTQLFSEEGATSVRTQCIERPDGSTILCSLQAAPIRRRNGQIAGIVEVLTDQTARAEAEEQLDRQRLSAQQKDIALREVLASMQEEKRDLGRHITKNMETSVLPILQALDATASDSQREYLRLLRANLHELTRPYVGEESQLFDRLSPTESRICQLIREGLETKEIARLEQVSAATVRKHREHIRRKLNLQGKSVNLATWLRKARSQQLADSMDMATVDTSEHRQHPACSGNSVRMHNTQ